jgi:hypothetical protein
LHLEGFHKNETFWAWITASATPVASGGGTNTAEAADSFRLTWSYHIFVSYLYFSYYNISVNHKFLYQGNII